MDLARLLLIKCRRNIHYRVISLKINVKIDDLSYLLGTGRKLDVYNRFRILTGRLLNVLFTLSLYLASRGYVLAIHTAKILSVFVVFLARISRIRSEYGSEKLQTRTLFTQCQFVYFVRLS